MELTTQQIHARFQANAQHRLNDGALIAELSQENPTEVLRVLNQYTQKIRQRIQAKAQEIADANGIKAETLLERCPANFARSFKFMDDCQKAYNILESVASLPPQADISQMLFNYSLLRKDYDAIVELMIVDAL